jgi:hypothetical protein
MRRRMPLKCWKRRPREEFITLVVFLVFLLGVLPVGCGEYDPRIAGTYTRLDNVSSMLKIRTENSHYIADLTGGGSETSGAAAPGDCHIRARGTLDGKTLMAGFLSIETETFLYDSKQAAEENRELKIIFREDIAEVVRADTFGYCGLGASFLGEYKRMAE